MCSEWQYGLIWACSGVVGGRSGVCARCGLTGRLGHMRLGESKEGHVHPPGGFPPHLSPPGWPSWPPGPTSSWPGYGYSTTRREGSAEPSWSTSESKACLGPSKDLPGRSRDQRQAVRALGEPSGEPSRRAVYSLKSSCQVAVPPCGLFFRDRPACGYQVPRLEG